MWRIIERRGRGTKEYNVWANDHLGLTEVLPNGEKPKVKGNDPTEVPMKLEEAHKTGVVPLKKRD